ncbi:MAG: NTP transferase domain-containing protein [Candidatus Moranbacteria bacterium]|nr:NTP transferase domain-containing protein [Candidatus Moranbacteria bacterium]
MKGIILSGGHGTRLLPLTKMTSKQLLPVYNRPMVYYPLNTLLKAGIKEILFVIAPDHAGNYLNLLGSGKEFGARFTYEIQDEPRGLAEAFIIAESFLDNGPVTMILGDNIFEDDFSEAIKGFKSGGRVFAKEVSDPKRFGVVEFDENKKAISIEEKPQNPKSNFAIPGLYIYDKRVVDFAKEVSPSQRGEIEITEIHKRYLALGELDVQIVRGEWVDAGTFDSLLSANQLAKERLASKMII